MLAALSASAEEAEEFARALAVKLAQAEKDFPHGNAEIKQGDRFRLMVSGRRAPWVAVNVLVQWQVSADHAAYLAYHTVRSGRQIRAMVAKACSNVLIDAVEGPLQCRCEPDRGDQCPQS